MIFIILIINYIICNNMLFNGISQILSELKTLNCCKLPDKEDIIRSVNECIYLFSNGMIQLIRFQKNVLL